MALFSAQSDTKLKLWYRPELTWKLWEKSALCLLSLLAQICSCIRRTQVFISFMSVNWELCDLFKISCMTFHVALSVFSLAMKHQILLILQTSLPSLLLPVGENYPLLRAFLLDKSSQIITFLNPNFPQDFIL
jgi:hypothetical protein